MTDKEIGEKLRKLRNKAGLSMDKLQVLTGVRKQHLSSYERGLKNVLSDENINKILNVYGLELQVVTKKEIKKKKINEK